MYVKCKHTNRVQHNILKLDIQIPNQKYSGKFKERKEASLVIALKVQNIFEK
jgi:hypothetical protein